MIRVQKACLQLVACLLLVTTLAVLYVHINLCWKRLSISRTTKCWSTLNQSGLIR